MTDSILWRFIHAISSLYIRYSIEIKSVPESVITFGSIKGEKQSRTSGITRYSSPSANAKGGEDLPG